MDTIWLVVMVCALSGSQCKSLTSDAVSFSSFEECGVAGYRLERAWLARHRGWQEGGVICSVRKPTP